MEKKPASKRKARPPWERTSSNGRRRRDVAALEKRRRQAARMFTRGKTQAAVARRLRVSRQSASRWYQAWEQDGAEALRATPLGRPAKLAKTQLGEIEQALLQGARAHGYPTDLWTLARVAAVVERLTGVRYHPGHVWKLLRRMGWSLQRPARRATERNEAKIRSWVREQWPRVKKTPGDAAPGSSSKTRAASPPSRRSAAPGRPAAARPS